MAREKRTHRQKDVARVLRGKKRTPEIGMGRGGKPPQAPHRPPPRRMTGGEMPALSADHLRQIRAHGLTETQVLEQLTCFRRGAAPIRLNRPCTTGDGILSIPARDRSAFVSGYEREAARGRFMKFVPSSGAASRMFREWFRCLDGDGYDTQEAAQAFAAEIGKFPFFEDVQGLFLQRGRSLAEELAQRRHRDVMEAILAAGGLNYGHLPKALLKFHRYPEGSRTALEEHLVEAALYVQDDHRLCRVHFTVSESHRDEIDLYLSGLKERYERQCGVGYDIGLSVQSADTDTIAVNMRNRPFLDEAGGIVLRPGGHGALLPNLNELAEGDIVFVKNIDNVVPDRLKAPTVFHKKLLGGYLVALQARIFQFLQRLENGLVDENELGAMLAFAEERLALIFPPGFSNLALSEKRSMVFTKLNRPIRVCGMVKNEGEPGGGPFWVDEEDGTQSLQIIEEHQVHSRSRVQRAIWSRATHFNPVDLVCGIRDYRGRKHDLMRYVDQRAFSIVKKTEKGRSLKALELPGFWNGGMAHWITVFVEVPLETFNPVKTVYDLLRPAHQGESEA